MSLGVYIHIPFCSRRCDYCDFATWVDKQDLIDSYFESISNQIKFHENNRELDSQIDTIFFGGGTPNLVPSLKIEKVLERLRNVCGFSPDIEVTVECNPDHVTKEQMRHYYSMGVNRISLGIQSTNDHVLKFLGREHDPENVYESIDHIFSSGITNVSGDLIYGSAVESLQDWENTLNDINSLNLKHVSAYALGVETGTPLYSSIIKGEKKNINEDDLANKYEIADEILNRNGYNWYEISNWSKPQYESKHNLSYWLGGDIVALGCAAHGFTKDKRWSTPRNLETYVNRFSPNSTNLINESCFKYHNDYSNLSSKQEKFALKIRTKYGIDWPHKSIPETVHKYIDLGMIVYNPNNSNISLTASGRLLAHTITVDLFEALECIDG
ncbi:MAG: radical SAM family heme chaperone HemW [Acidimicrobiia bacterium]